MNKKILSLVILCIAFLAGCGRQYQVKPLRHVKKTDAQFIEKKENIELRVKKLDHPDIQRIFSEQDLENKRISSLLITIKNDSTEKVIFDQQTCGLTLLSAKELQEYLARATYSKIFIGVCAIPVLIAASIFTGMIAATIATAAGCCACCGGMAAFLFTIFAGISIGTPVIIGTTGYSIHDANKFNAQLATDLKRKVLDVLTIAPSKKESALLFVKGLPESFTITLLKGQEKVPFTVTLKNLETTKVKQPQTKKQS